MCVPFMQSGRMWLMGAVFYYTHKKTQKHPLADQTQVNNVFASKKAMLLNPKCLFDRMRS